MRILYIGCVESSYQLLEQLISLKADIVGVITKESSDFNSDYRDLTQLCRANDIDYYYVKNINDKDAVVYMKNVDAEIAFCFGWSQLIKKEVLALLPEGVLGFHPAMLPYNRGRHPIIWALALGLTETASTFFRLEEEADTGEIVSQEKVEITLSDDALSLYNKIMLTAKTQVAEILTALDHCGLTGRKQTAGIGNAWRKRSKKDGEIDFRMTKRAFYNLVRSLTRPYPGAHFVWEDRIYKVWRVEEADMEGYENIEPGKVLAVSSPQEFCVKVYDGVIRILECDPVLLKEGDYL